MDLSGLDFEPIKFLRIHSKNRDSADVQTQVWSCAIEPDIGKKFEPGAITVATCGGNSVCFVDCTTGTLLAKYITRDLCMNLFSLAWSKFVDQKTGAQSILAIGGSSRSLYIIDTAQRICVLENIEKKSLRKVTVNSLCFHPTEQNILFCGCSDGEVRLYQLSRDPKGSFSLELCQTFATQSEVYDLSFCLTLNCLLSSSEDGIKCFHFPTKETLKTKVKKERDSGWLTLNVRGIGEERSVLVDSVKALGNGLIACKYALHGCIYICDLATLLQPHVGTSGGCLTLRPLHTLLWSDTDNYYMYMDANPACGLLCCGDDRGNLWLYDLGSILNTRQSESLSSPDQEPPLHRPVALLPWPSLRDHFTDKKRKLSLGKYDILIDRVAIHSSSHFLIAVTNNNLVCLWRRVDSQSVKGVA